MTNHTKFSIHSYTCSHNKSAERLSEFLSVPTIYEAPRWMMTIIPTDHDLGTNTNGGRELRRWQGKELLELSTAVRDASASQILGMFFITLSTY